MRGWSLDCGIRCLRNSLYRTFKLLKVSMIIKWSWRLGAFLERDGLLPISLTFHHWNKPRPGELGTEIHCSDELENIFVNKFSRHFLCSLFHDLIWFALSSYNHVLHLLLELVPVTPFHMNHAAPNSQGSRNTAISSLYFSSCLFFWLHSLGLEVGEYSDQPTPSVLTTSESRHS